MPDNFKFSRLLRIPDDIETAPIGAGGVYLISYRFPNSFELGLTKELDDYEAVLDGIRSKIELLFRLSTIKVIEGIVSDNTFGRHLTTEYDISLKKITSNWIDLFNSEIDQVERNLDSIIDLVSIINIAVRELPPLYVGLAKKQSIRDRIWQHRNGDTGFSKRLLDNSVLWTDLGFRYLIVPKGKVQYLRRYEKIIQSVTLPSLSRL